MEVKTENIQKENSGGNGEGIPTTQDCEWEGQTDAQAGVEKKLCKPVTLCQT